jgi:hypothetical protein
MPVNATMEQRLEWHLEHAEYCVCRPIPANVTEEMKKRKVRLSSSKSLHGIADKPGSR